MFDEATKELIKNNNKFFYNRLKEFEYMHNALINYVDNYREPVIYDKTFISNDNIISISKKIIDSLNIKEYSEVFDYIIKNNQIKFKKDIDGSRFKRVGERSNWEIEIEEKNEYLDIVILVHEFMHYMSSIKGEQVSTRGIFGEAVSIYFENYAIDYLLNNGLDKNKLTNYNRMYSTYDSLAKPLNNREDYFSKDLTDEEYIRRLYAYYKHLLGLYIGEWSKDKVDISKMVELNEIMDKTYTMQDIYDYIGFNNIYRLTDDVIDILKNNNKKIR